MTARKQHEIAHAHQALRRLARTAAPRWKTLAWIGVVQVLDGCAPIVAAAINRAVVDRFLGHASVWSLASLWGLLVIGVGLLSGVAIRSTLRIGGEFTDELSRRVFARLLHQSPGYHERHGISAAHTLLTRGIGEIEQANNLFCFAVSLIALAAGALIALARVGGGWLLLGVVLLLVTSLGSWLLSRSLLRASAALVEAEEPRTALISEVFDDHRFPVIWRNVLERRFNARFAAIAGERTPIFQQRVNAHTRMMQGAWSIPLLAFPVAWLLGPYRDATVGQIVVLAALLSQTLFVASRGGDFLGWLAATGPYLTRARRVLTEPLEDQRPADPSILPEDLAGESVIFESLRCTLGTHPVLRGVDLIVPPGSYTAIVGPNGVGKTTLLKILTGQVTADGDGRAARIGAFPITEIPREVLKEHVRAIDSRPVTFTGTALENVTFLRDDPTAEEIDRACRIAQIAYPLDTRTHKLSDGEKVQMLLAQVLLARPRVLLLDECLNDLHPTLRRSVRDALRREIPTVFEVVHEGAVTSQAVTNIVVIEDGVVAEHGTHAQLRRMGRRYARYVADSQR